MITHKILFTCFRKATFDHVKNVSMQISDCKQRVKIQKAPKENLIGVVINIDCVLKGIHGKDTFVCRLNRLIKMWQSIFENL